MKTCHYCSSNSLICKGKRGLIQRYYCTSCHKYQQDMYRYRLYDPKDDKMIKLYHCEGLGIRSISRILGYSSNTIMRRILFLGFSVTKPAYLESNQIYEVDELCTYVGRNHSSHHKWIIYAINRSTKTVVDVAIGSRSRDNIGKVIGTIKSLNPRKIITDKLPVYVNLIQPIKHDTHRYSNNHIERGNLTLRTHIKRLFRKTICYSKNLNMLKASILLYLDHRNWKLDAL